MTYYGYVLGAASPNYGEVAGPLILWSAVVLVVLSIPLRKATGMFLSSVRTRLGAGVFAGYIMIHLVLYGFLLEGILAALYGAGAFVVPPGLFVATDVILPPSALSLGLELTYNPQFVLNVPPLFSADLSMYAVAVAFVVAVLVVANIEETRTLRRLRSETGRARAFVLLPALGTILGASCCVSVAGLVGLAIPSTEVVLSVLWVYYVTYFVLPLVAIALLVLNLYSTSKISKVLRGQA